MQVFDGKKHFKASIEDVKSGPMTERARHYGVQIKPLSQVDSGAPLVARINWNRWIVDCPDCHGAEFVWLDNPVLMCQFCWNGAVGGKWRRVTLPPNVAAIEAVLRMRPSPTDRNWEPDETIAFLKAENRAHDLKDEVG